MMRSLLIAVLLASSALPLAAADRPTKFRPWPERRDSHSAAALRIARMLADPSESVDNRLEACLALAEDFRFTLRTREDLAWVNQTLTELSLTGPGPLRGAAALALDQIFGYGTARAVTRAKDRADLAARGARPAKGDKLPLLTQARDAADRQRVIRTLESAGVRAINELVEAIARPAAPRGTPEFDAERAGLEWRLWCLLGPDEAAFVLDVARRGPKLDLDGQWRLDLSAEGPACDRGRRIAARSRGELRLLHIEALKRLSAGTGDNPPDAPVRRRAASLLPLLTGPGRRADEAADLRLIERATGSTSPGVRTVDALFRRYVPDVPNPPLDVERAAFTTWAALTDKAGVLLPGAAPVVADAALGWYAARRNPDPRTSAVTRWVDQSLDKSVIGLYAPRPIRTAIVTRFSLAAGLGDRTARELLRRWRLDDVPAARFALDTDPEDRLDAPFAVRAWYARTLIGRGRPAETMADLLSSDWHRAGALRAATAVLAAADERATVIETAVPAGKSIPAETVAALALPADVAARTADNVWPRLADADPRVAAAALEAVAALGVSDPNRRAEIESRWLRADDRRSRTLAARVLDTDDARRVVGTRDLLDDLRAPEPSHRAVAARQLHDLAIDAPAVTAALVRATDAGDFAVREGLTIALTRAWRQRTPVGPVLDAADAEPDPTTRAYLRAARRAINAGNAAPK